LFWPYPIQPAPPTHKEPFRSWAPPGDLLQLTFETDPTSPTAGQSRLAEPGQPRMLEREAGRIPGASATPMNPDTPVRTIAHRDYVRVIRPRLPPEAFRPAPRKVWAIVGHTTIAAAGTWAIVEIDHLWVRAILALVVGHGLACMAFFGHELSHNAIIRSARWRYLLELLVWSPRLMPATVWRRVHNAQHHRNSNTTADCDRHVLASELSRPVRVLSRLMTPFDNWVRWNPLVGLAFVEYTLSHVAMAFINGRRPGPPGPFRVPYRRGELPRVAGEVAVIATVQAGIFALARGDVLTYLWCGPVPIAISSTITMAYIFTNHFLNPITEDVDPVLGSTSVAVPRFVDRMHAHFSYHTEHHLFPSLDSAYYPLVSRILALEFPNRYSRVRFGRAWRRLWSIPLGARVEPSVRVSLDSARAHQAGSPANPR
jgi:fatty acid desaturase